MMAFRFDSVFRLYIGGSMDLSQQWGTFEVVCSTVPLFASKPFLYVASTISLSLSLSLVGCLLFY